MSDYAKRHPIDVIEQLRIRYKAVALIADVMREIEEYRIEHAVDAKITPALHVAEIDIPPEVLAAIHEFNYQLQDAECSIETWFQKTWRCAVHASEHPPSTRGRRPTARSRGSRASGTRKATTPPMGTLTLAGSDPHGGRRFPGRRRDRLAVVVVGRARSRWHRRTVDARGRAGLAA